MTIEADFSGSGEPTTPEREPVPDVDSIDELKRIVGEHEPTPRLPKVLTVPRRRRGR
jgi:hypothetical protein